MNKSKKAILFPTLTLVIITLIIGVLIGFFNEITKLSDAEIEKRALGKLQKSLPNEAGYERLEFTSSDKELNEKVSYFLKANGMEDTYVIIVESSQKGYNGIIQMYVVFKGENINKIVGGTNKESPGISDKAFNESFYSKIIARVGDVTSADIFGLDIDGVTNATFSSNGITSAVLNAAAFYKEFLLFKVGV